MIDHVHSGDGRPKQPGLSAAVRVGSLLFVAGQPPYAADAWGVTVEGGIAAQARQVLENLAATVAAAGGSLSNLVSVTVYLSDIAADFEAFSRVYEEIIPAPRPARMTLGCVLPSGMLIEAQCIAVVPDRDGDDEG